jgi:hypothetical protein
MNTQERRTITVGNITIRLQSRAMVITSDQREVIPKSSPINRPQTPASAERPHVPTRSKTPSKRVTCIHRGSQIGKIDCGCRGLKPVYKCKVCVRPSTSPTEPAFCTDYKLIKYFGIILNDGTKLQATEVPMSEIIVCDRQHCDQYSPSVSLSSAKPSHAETINTPPSTSRKASPSRYQLTPQKNPSRMLANP